MKQIKIFKVPQQVSEVNDFLAKNPPEQVSTIVQGGFFNSQAFTIVNYDDQSYPDHYKAEEIRGLMLSNTKQKMTSEISMNVMKTDLIKYEAELKALEVELPEDMPSKEKYDKEKERTEQATKIKQTISSIQKGIEELTESIKRFELRNAVMAEHLSELSL